MTREEVIAAARKQATEDFLKRTPDGQRMTNVAAGEPWKPTAFDMEAQQHETTLAPGAAEPEDGGMMQDIGHMAKAGVIPGVTSAMGTAAGAALPIPGGAVMGGMLGSGAGEKINQMLGITEPSDMAVYANTAAPLVGRGLAAGMGSMKRNAARLIPGSGAAINEMAAETAAKIPGQLAPDRTMHGIMKLIDIKNPGANTSTVQQALTAKMQQLAQTPNMPVSQVLYGITDDLAKNSGSSVTVLSSNIKAAAQKLLDKEAKMGAATGSAELKALAGEFDGLVNSNQYGIPFDVLYARLQRLNGEVGGAKGELQGAYKTMIGAIENDIEAAVTSSNSNLPAAQAFRAAQAAWKSEKGASEVKDLITRATTTRDSDELVRFNRGTITKALSNDKRLQKLLGPKGVAFVRDELSDIGIITNLPPGPGQHFGSGRNIIGAGAGFAASALSGHDPVVASAVAAAVPAAMEVISKAAMTETGRTMIKHFAKAGKGKIGPAAVSILSAYIEGGTHILDGAAEMAVGE